MIHIICALKCEATPLLQHFGLQHCGGENQFRSYANDQAGISLTVTGVGKINAAAATMHAIHYFKARAQDVWLNIGIAGHRDLPLGSIRLANRIMDAATGEVWYPQILLRTPLSSCTLTTVDAPATNYGDAMVDMEAAGFYAIACRIGTVEMIHCLKLISDNEQSPPAGLRAKEISVLIADKISDIEDIAGQLHGLSLQLSNAGDTPELLASFLERWHFTETQRNRLKSLLRRWNILLPDKIPTDVTPSTLKHGADVLGFLEQTLDAVPVNFYHAQRPDSERPN